MSPQHWIVKSSQYILKTPWLSLLKQSVQTHAASVIPDFYLIVEKHWAMTVPLIRPSRSNVSVSSLEWENLLECKVLLIQQYRHGASRLSWEFPAGQIDAQEETEKAALRELREETGAENLELISCLGSIYSEPARNTNVGHGYLVWCDWNHKEMEQQLDEHEQIHVEAVPLKDVLQMVQKGEIIHGAHLGFMLKAHLYLEKECRRKL